MQSRTCFATIATARPRHSPLHLRPPTTHPPPRANRDTAQTIGSPPGQLGPRAIDVMVVEVVMVVVVVVVMVVGVVMVVVLVMVLVIVLVFVVKVVVVAMVVVMVVVAKVFVVVVVVVMAMAFVVVVFVVMVGEVPVQKPKKTRKESSTTYVLHRPSASPVSTTVSSPSSIAARCTSCRCYETLEQSWSARQISDPVLPRKRALSTHSHALVPIHTQSYLLTHSITHSLT